ERADTRISAPREDQLRDAAGANQLVVDDVRRHPDDRQIAPALANDLVPRRKRNQVGKPFERNDVTVANEVVNRVCEGRDSSQEGESYSGLRAAGYRRRTASGLEAGASSLAARQPLRRSTSSGGVHV